jgi:hypothetical protein
MPLIQLGLNGCGLARGFQVLNEISSLELLTLPELPQLLPEDEITAIDGLRKHPTLRQIQMGGGTPGMSVRHDLLHGEFWKKVGRSYSCCAPGSQGGVEDLRDESA